MSLFPNLPPLPEYREEKEPAARWPVGKGRNNPRGVGTTKERVRHGRDSEDFADWSGRYLPGGLGVDVRQRRPSAGDAAGISTTHHAGRAAARSAGSVPPGARLFPGRLCATHCSDGFSSRRHIPAGRVVGRCGGHLGTGAIPFSIRKNLPIRRRPAGWCQGDVRPSLS